MYPTLDEVYRSQFFRLKKETNEVFSARRVRVWGGSWDYAIVIIGKGLYIHIRTSTTHIREMNLSLWACISTCTSLIVAKYYITRWVYLTHLSTLINSNHSNWKNRSVIHHNASTKSHLNVLLLRSFIVISHIPRRVIFATWQRLEQAKYINAFSIL